MEIKITRAATLKEKPDSSKLVFGKAMTDHMFIVDYDEGQGWHDARIVPYGPLSIDPAAKVLHYGGDLRGPEGLPHRRRLHPAVPPQGQHRPDEQLRRPPVPAPDS